MNRAHALSANSVRAPPLDPCASNKATSKKKHNLASSLPPPPPPLRSPSDFTAYFSSSGSPLIPEEFDQAVRGALEEHSKCISDNSAQSWFCAFGILKEGKEAKLRLGVGIYAAALTVWQSIFDAEQLLVLRSEDLRCDRTAVLDRVFAHIFVRPPAQLGSAIMDIAMDQRAPGANERDASRSFRPSAATMASLRRFYAPHNRRLAALLDDRRFLWEDAPCSNGTHV